MIRLFGKVCQNGYVVRDIEAALRFWTQTLRVGQFIESVGSLGGRNGGERSSRGTVMPGLVPGIHAGKRSDTRRTSAALSDIS